MIIVEVKMIFTPVRAGAVPREMVYLCNICNSFKAFWNGVNDDEAWILTREHLKKEHANVLWLIKNSGKTPEYLSDGIVDDLSFFLGWQDNR